MPLPFLEPRKIAAVIVAKHKDGKLEDREEHSHGLLSAAEDLIRAVHAKDAEAVAEALTRAHQEADKQEHFEGPHTNEE